MCHPGHADEALDKLQHSALSVGGVRSLGMNFAAMRCMFKSHVRIVCTIPYDTLTIAAMSFSFSDDPHAQAVRLFPHF